MRNPLSNHPYTIHPPPPSNAPYDFTAHPPYPPPPIHPHNPFRKLAAEILQEIYLHSLNINLPYTCRTLYQFLNDDSLRLQICTEILTRHKLSVRCPGQPILVWERTQMFRQRWFDEEFSARVEAASGFSKPPSPRKWEEVGPRPTFSGAGPVRNDPYLRRPLFYSMASGRLFPGGQSFFSPTALQLPSRLFRRYWDESRDTLLRRLLHWGAKLHKQQERICYEAMKDVMIHGSVESLVLLLSIGPVFDHTLWRIGVFTSADRAKMKVLVQFEEEYAQRIIDWEDKQVLEWARDMVEREKKEKREKALEDLSLAKVKDGNWTDEEEENQWEIDSEVEHIEGHGPPWRYLLGIIADKRPPLSCEDDSGEDDDGEDDDGEDDDGEDDDGEDDDGEDDDGEDDDDEADDSQYEGSETEYVDRYP